MRISEGASELFSRHGSVFNLGSTGTFLCRRSLASPFRPARRLKLFVDAHLVGLRTCTYVRASDLA